MRKKANTGAAEKAGFKIQVEKTGKLTECEGRLEFRTGIKVSTTRKNAANFFRKKERVMKLGSKCRHQNMNSDGKTEALYTVGTKSIGKFQTTINNILIINLTQDTITIFGDLLL